MSTFPLGAADEAIVAHELAHQWFGNSVSIKRWEDLWLAEGPATYFEVLWPNRNDPEGFEEEMLDIHAYNVEAPVGPAVVDSPEEMFSPPFQVYYRGAIVLYALRLKVGDATFFRILRRFLDDNRNGNVTTADFIDTAVRVSGDGSVRPLLVSFIYDETVPDLPGQTGVHARRGPVEQPPIVGARCGRAAHRGAPAHCGEAVARH
jgi:aminopeptidase N